ncbi:MAG TPA: hypothetical protein VFD90_18665 [Gaiellales bacterium]|jgi:hypothetical protein|nr:hypothetical protein [Gaiellales bacterium]
MSRTLRTVVIAAGAVAAIASGAPSASLAGATLPPAPTVTVRGTIASYHVSGRGVQIVALANGRCSALDWVPGAPPPQAHAVAASRCTNARTPAQSEQLAEAARGQLPQAVTSGNARVAVTGGGLDAAQVLVVRDRASGRILHRWPLPDEVSSLAVGHGIAVLATVRHQGLYAVRLSDGRLRIVGLMGWLDRPALGASGIVFRDDMYGRRNERRGQAVLQYLSWKDVDAALDDASTSYTAAGAQPAWAYDGQRVVMAMRDPAIPCDRVHFWNVAWDRRVQLTQVADHICPGGAGTHVKALALGGVRAAWLVENLAGRRWLISATIVACEERIVAKAPAGNAGASERGLVGDGGLVAFSAIGAPGVQAIWRNRAVAGSSNVKGKALAPGTGSLALSADADRVAVLERGGRVEIRSKFGALGGVVRTPGARAVSLRGGSLAVLAANHLDLYDVASGTRVHSWRAPARARSVDMQFGVATVAAGRRVYAVRLATGHTAMLATAPSRVEAQIEAPGVVYRYDAAGSGEFRFVPFAKVLRALAR